MPESEIGKLILQGGAFGLLATWTVWFMVWGFPAMMADRQKDREHNWMIFNALLGMIVAESKEQKAFFLQLLTSGILAKANNPNGQHEQVPRR